MASDFEYPQISGSRWLDLEHPYAGRVAVLATKHGKLPLIGPPIEQATGMTVRDVDVDTDTLGTFTGDIPRIETPLNTAIAKARMGMEAAGVEIGLASEGSIAPDPALPFVVADRELVVLVDGSAEIIVWESCSSWEILAATITASTVDGLESFLERADFPNHKLIVRPNSGSVYPVYKGIDDVDELVAALGECVAVSADGLVVVETDLRAHMCPSRRTVIAKAAGRLALRLATRCPACGAPGWGRVDVLLGLPCVSCGTQVDRPRAEIDACVTCDHRETRIIATGADPGECPACNP